MAGEDPQTSSIQPQRRTKAILVASTFLFLLAVGIYVVRAAPGGPQVANALSLSAVVLTGLTLVVVLMAGLVLIYSYTDVANENQALALPEGSVRALLAFSLVVIFVAIAAFLYSNVNAPDLTFTSTHDRVTEDDLTYLKAHFVVISDPILVATDDKGKQCVAPRSALKQGSQIVEGGHTAPSSDMNAGVSFVDCQSLIGSQILNTEGKPLFRATVYQQRSKDSDDFAKLIFTTLAGVFISVVSFYFGSSTTSSAVAAGVRATGRDPNPAAQQKADADAAKAKADAETAKALALANTGGNPAPANAVPIRPAVGG